MIKVLDRVGSVGALAAAVAAPCCFPLFATVAAGVGLGFLGRFETAVLYIFQAFSLLAVIGLAISYRAHRNLGPLLLGVLGLAALANTFYRSWSLELLYAGLFGVVVASIWNWFCHRARRIKEPVLQSVIACPSCGHRSEETMPTNACLYYYECTGCRKMLKPKSGDCCVFCSYGSVPCPPVQVGNACCT